MQQRRFRQVDVFTAEPYKGNPVAVVLDGDGLSTAQMQAIAVWAVIAMSPSRMKTTRYGWAVWR